MTVDELGVRMSAHELVSWQVFARVEPFGEERADWRTATLLAFHANLNRDEQKRPQPYEPGNFLHDLDFEQRWEEAAEAADPELAKERAEARARAILAKVSAAREIMSSV